jgi:hypothetical protein
MVKSGVVYLSLKDQLEKAQLKPAFIWIVFPDKE